MCKQIAVCTVHTGAPHLYSNMSTPRLIKMNEWDIETCAPVMVCDTVTICDIPVQSKYSTPEMEPICDNVTEVQNTHGELGHACLLTDRLYPPSTQYETSPNPNHGDGKGGTSASRMDGLIRRAIHHPQPLFVPLLLPGRSMEQCMRARLHCSPIQTR